jgi:hypothetical protein
MEQERAEAFECLATAAVLRSGRTIALAGHAGALMSLLPLSRGGAAAWIACCSVLAWCGVVYFAMRVQIDSRLFELLATYPADLLDRFLVEEGLHRELPPRSMADRRSGAMGLWRTLVAAFVAQTVLLLLAIVRLLA